MYNKIRTFDVLTNQWDIVPRKFIEQITPRRNHSACIIGNKMFIYGGIDS